MSTDQTLSPGFRGPTGELSAAIAALKAAPEAERRKVYEKLVFPHAVARVLAERADAVALRLLIVPVGTQPWSPLLAILSAPAERVALLVTEPEPSGLPGSRPTAEEVCTFLRNAGEPWSQLPIALFSIGDGLRGERVADGVDAARVWASDPWPLDIGVDISGGRKSTTAALGGIAAALGYRLSYIEGSNIGGGYFAHEKRHVLADMGGLLVVDGRATATRLLEIGNFVEAARELERVQGSLVAGRGVEVLVQVVKRLATLVADPSNDPFGSLAGSAVSMPDLADGAGSETLAQVLREGAPDAQRFALSVLDALRDEGAWR